MQVMSGDMNDSQPIDENLAEYILKSVKDIEKTEDYQIASELQTISSAIARLSIMKGDLSPFSPELDILVARLTKVAQRALNG